MVNSLISWLDLLIVAWFALKLIKWVWSYLYHLVANQLISAPKANEGPDQTRFIKVPRQSVTVNHPDTFPQHLLEQDGAQSEPEAE